jgi:hypothetical protein
VRSNDAEWNGRSRNGKRSAAGAQRPRNMAKNDARNVRHSGRAPERNGEAMNGGRGIRCHAIEISDEAADA